MLIVFGKIICVYATIKGLNHGTILTMESPTRKKPRPKLKKLPKVDKILEYKKRDVVAVIDSKPPEEGEAIKLPTCKFRDCRNFVTAMGVDNKFCCQTCYAFHQRENFKKKFKPGASGEIQYKKDYALSSFYEYIKRCEQSHEPFFVSHAGTMIPISRVMFPSIEGFSRHSGIPRETLEYWAKISSEFYQLMKELKSFQKQYLMDFGVSGRYNPGITKLMLMNNHGMKEKSETNINQHIGIVKATYERADVYEQDKGMEELLNEED